MTACVTSSIEIAARGDGVRYIPMHTLLARKGVQLAIPVGHQRLIPDQLFALDYGGSYRVFAVEVDRGTEPLSSTVARKSYVSSIAAYDQMLRQGLHRQHYGLKANLLVLWIFAARQRALSFLALCAERAPALSANVLVQWVDGFAPCLAPGPCLAQLYASPWLRANAPPLPIARVDGP